MSKDPAHVIISRAGQSQVVRVRGEIDLSNAATAGRDLAASIAESRFALDLNGVTFIDSAGLRMLNDLTRRFDVALILAPNAVVRRAIEFVGLGEAVPIFDFLAEAESSFL